MNINEFLERRRAEKEWLEANGYENEKSEVNGEFFVLDHFAKSMGVFIDVGANKGEFCERVLLANKEINIIAYEPNKALIPVINERIDKKTDSIVLNMALADTKGKAEFYYHPDFDTVSSLYERSEMMPKFRNEMRGVEVEIDILDNYINTISEKAHSDGVFIKIDVEGAELDVIKGSQAVLKRDAPTAVLFEYAYGWKEADNTFKETFHLFDNLGYSLYRITPLGLELLRFFTQDMENYMYSNYLALKNIHIEDHFKQFNINTLHGESLFLSFGSVMN